MSRIRFTVEDSRVSEILKELLNLGIEITDLEVNTSEYDKDLEAVKKYIPDSGYIPPKRKLDDEDNYWEFRHLGKDRFYTETVRINDEGFDYTGSTKMPDNVYQYQSTTDVKSPNNWIPKVKTSTGCTVETETLAKPSSELDKTISMKSELDFPYYKET